MLQNTLDVRKFAARKLLNSHKHLSIWEDHSGNLFLRFCFIGNTSVSVSASFLHDNVRLATVYLHMGPLWGQIRGWRLWDLRIYSRMELGDPITSSGALVATRGCWGLLPGLHFLSPLSQDFPVSPSNVCCGYSAQHHNACRTSNRNVGIDASSLPTECLSW